MKQSHREARVIAVFRSARQIDRKQCRLNGGPSHKESQDIELSFCVLEGCSVVTAVLRVRKSADDILVQFLLRLFALTDADLTLSPISRFDDVLVT